MMEVGFRQRNHQGINTSLTVHLRKYGHLHLRIRTLNNSVIRKRKAISINILYCPKLWKE